MSALPQSLEQHRILNVKQAAEVLGFSVAHFRKLYRTGKVPQGRRIGGRKLGWPTSVIVKLASPDGSDQG